MIAVDLDGTLLGGTSPHYGCLPSGLTSLRRAFNLGTRICLITGRDLDYIRELLDREKVVPRTEGWPSVLIPEERLVFYWQGSSFEPDERWNHMVLAAERSHFTFLQREVGLLLDKMIVQQMDSSARLANKVKEEQRGFVEIIFGSSEAARQGEALLRKWLAEQQLPYLPVRNIAGVAVRHESVGKGKVLAHVCEALGFDRSRVLAVGDSTNDLSMLDGTLGFAPAAPANAEPEVKEVVSRAGGYIACGMYGEGIAETLRILLAKS